MKKIRFEQITKTYNGKTGCACGCNGTYTIPSHITIEEANKSVGWNAYNERSISDRRAKIALNKINRAIDEYGAWVKMTREGVFEYSKKDVWFCYSASFVAIDINGRSTTVYFEN